MGFKRPLHATGGFRSVGLSDAYRDWVCQSLAEGVAPSEICRLLVAQGVDEALALREVDIVEGATRSLRQRSKRMELQLRLQGELDGSPLAIREQIAEEEFYRYYYGGNRPVLLPGLVAHWPQCKRWSPSWLKEHYGRTLIDVNDQRTSDLNKQIDPESHLTPMKLGEFLDRVETERGNDVYMVSRNRALEGPLAPLLDDIDNVPEFLEPDIRGCASLWIGPAGTVTSLHHDTTNVLFCQIHGSKRIRLISPRSLPTLTGALESTFYSQGDAVEDRHEFFVEVSSGDALFLPVGWWHEIEAITPSISLSLTNFKRKNHFDWYRPGDF